MVFGTKFHGCTHPFFVKSETIFFQNFTEYIVPMGFFFATQTDENVMFLFHTASVARLSLSVLSTACQNFQAN